VADKWRATVELWPYSGYRQQDVGPRRVTVIVCGDTLREAARSLDMFISGAKTNWRVWEVKVISLEWLHGADAQDALAIGQWAGETEISGEVVRDNSVNRHCPRI